MRLENRLDGGCSEKRYLTFSLHLVQWRQPACSLVNKCGCKRHKDNIGAQGRCLQNVPREHDPEEWQNAAFFVSLFANTNKFNERPLKCLCSIKCYMILLS
jgi:hypothetical protein